MKQQRFQALPAMNSHPAACPGVSCNMLRYFTFILILSFASTLCFGQTKAELKKITQFKKSFLKNAKLNYRDTLIVGNLKIIGERFYEFRDIKTFDKAKGYVVGEQFYDNIKQIKRITTYDTIGRPFGIAKHYTKKGALQYIQNYENGEWVVYDKQSHPYYVLQNNIKTKADSLISIMYGDNFLRNHSLWMIDGSYISTDKKERIRWTEMLKEKPTKFSFCYKVKLDSQKNYNSYIYFDLDTNGNFLPNWLGGGFFFSGFGFENVPDSLKGKFRLSYAEALSKAKNLGLKETDNTKEYGRLFWEDFRKNNIYNGQFRFYVIIETSETVESSANGSFLRTTKYDAYSFNPWSGEFIEIKKMKQEYRKSKERTTFTDLIPEKD